MQSIGNMFSTFYGGNYHPFTTLSQTIVYHFWGLNPKPFHWVNFIVHLLNVILVFRLIFLLSAKKEAALIVTLFFAIHPMHVESVSWITESKDLLYSFFYLGSLICYIGYIKSEEASRIAEMNSRYYLMSLLLFLFSLLSKSMAVSLPVVLILIDYYFNRKISKKSMLDKAAFFILSLLFGIIALYSQGAAGAMDLIPVYSFVDKIFLSGYTVVFYIVKLLVPTSLSALYPFVDTITGGFAIQCYLALLFIFLIIWGIYKSGKYRKELIFGTAFFLITISLVLQIIPVGRAMAADRYTYIPSIGLFFIIAQFYCSISENKSRLTNKIKPYFILILISYTAIFSINTWNRNKVWENGITLFSDVIKKNPGLALAYNNRGSVKNDLQQYSAAIPDFSEAIRLNPNYYEAYYNRGIAKGRIQDNSGAKPDYTDAVADYTQAIHINPLFADAYNNRGLTKGVSGDLDGALADFKEAVRINPLNAFAFCNLAIAESFYTNYDQALKDFDKSIHLFPDYGRAYFERGKVKLKISKTEEACYDLGKAAELKYPEANDTLWKYCR